MMSQGNDSIKRKVRLELPAGDPITIGYKDTFAPMSFEKFLFTLADNFRKQGQPVLADTISSMTKKDARNEGMKLNGDTLMSQLFFSLVNKGGMEESVATVKFQDIQSGGL